MTSTRARVGVLVASCGLCCVAALGDDSDKRCDKYMQLALAEAEKIEDAGAKAYFFYFRETDQLRAGDQKGASESLRRIGELAAAAKNEQTDLLYAIQARDDRARQGDVEGVLQLLQKAEPYAKSSGLQRLGGDRQEGVDLATRKQLLAHAFREAQGITKRSNHEEDDGHIVKYQLLFFIAVDQGKAKDEAGALRTIKAIPVDGQYGSLYHYLACCYEGIRFAKNGNEEGSLALIDEAARTLDTIEDIPIPKREQVRKKAATIESNLSKLAEAQATARKVADAIKTAERLQSPERKAQALGEVARVRIEANDPEGAAQAIHAMETSHAKVDALLALAKAHLEAKATDKAKAVVKEALEVAKAVPGAEKSRVLRETSESQARVGDFAGAAETAGAIVAPAEQAQAWRKLARFQQRAGDTEAAAKSVERALTAAQEVASNSWKADFYGLAADVLAALGNREAAQANYKTASVAVTAITELHAQPSAEKLAGEVLAGQYRIGATTDAEETVKRIIERAHKAPIQPGTFYPEFETARQLMVVTQQLTADGVEDKNLGWIKDLKSPAERAWAYEGAARGFLLDIKRKDD